MASETDTKAEQHFEKANELRKVADYDAAIAEYEKVMSLSPRSKIAQDAQYWMGQSYFKERRYDAALSAFEKLLTEYPENAIVPSTKLMMERVQQAKNTQSLLEAVKKGNIDLVKSLISSGANINAKDDRGMTPLHEAAYYGQREVAKVLIAKGANVNETDTAGQTPLHIAANFGAKFVPELLLANGANISARDVAGNTPLHAAAYCLEGSPTRDLLELLIA
jgi:ankyrin repeat protein